MILRAPEYCLSFKCIADKCQHTCCADWEIDIDEETYETYEGLNNSLGEKIMSRSTPPTDGNLAHFNLTSDEKCPFLREDGLCEMIIEAGDGILCDICREHPRFYNYRAGITEMGIGLCCEEACRIILNWDKPVLFVDREIETLDEEDETDELEEEVFAVRDRNLVIAADSDMSFDKKLENISCGELRSLQKLLELAQKLEYMDETFKSLMLSKIETAPTDFETATSKQLKVMNNLLQYFVYRYPWEEGKVAAELCRMAVILIWDEDFDNMPLVEDHIRRFSSEIEYSDCNIDTIGL